MSEHNVNRCIDEVWPHLPACAANPGPGAVIVPCPWASSTVESGPEWDDCPQVGVGGCHSSAFYDGAPCCWCGVKLTEAQLALLNEQFDG